MIESRNGLTNYELEKYSKKIIGNTFLGVFPSDDFPKLFSTKKNTSVIFNLSKSNESGTHFIAIFKKGKKIYYFDSFGEICKNKNILKFLKLHTNTIYCNVKKIQSLTSNFCGLYCLSFLIVCQKNNKPFSYFLKQFKPIYKKNDKIALNIILSNC